jgi:hypothetical protein
MAANKSEKEIKKIDGLNKIFLEAINKAKLVLEQKYEFNQLVSSEENQLEGDSNFIQIYRADDDGSNFDLVVRVGKKAWKPKNNKLKVPESDPELGVFLKKYQNLYPQDYATYHVWKEADSKGLCPKIFYYGYLPFDNQGRVVLCIVSKRYKINLQELYTNEVPKLTQDADSSISDQIISLFTKLVDLNIMCVDIKPPNIVIDYSLLNNNSIDAKSIDVKLIDLDGDFCGEFYSDQGREKEDREALTYMTLMFISNFLFKDFERNILSSHMVQLYNMFDSDRTKLTGLIKRMYELFDYTTNDSKFSNNKYDFYERARWYFNATILSKDRFYLFVHLLQNSFYKNVDGYLEHVSEMYQFKNSLVTILDVDIAPIQYEKLDDPEKSVVYRTKEPEVYQNIGELKMRGKSSSTDMYIILNSGISKDDYTSTLLELFSSSNNKIRLECSETAFNNICTYSSDSYSKLKTSNSKKTHHIAVKELIVSIKGFLAIPENSHVCDHLESLRLDEINGEQFQTALSGYIDTKKLKKLVLEGNVVDKQIGSFLNGLQSLQILEFLNCKLPINTTSIPNQLTDLRLENCSQINLDSKNSFDSLTCVSIVRCNTITNQKLLEFLRKNGQKLQLLEINGFDVEDNTMNQLLEIIKQRCCFIIDGWYLRVFDSINLQELDEKILRAVIANKDSLTTLNFSTLITISSLGEKYTDQEVETGNVAEDLLFAVSNQFSGRKDQDKGVTVIIRSKYDARYIYELLQAPPCTIIRDDSQTS